MDIDRDFLSGAGGWLMYSQGLSISIAKPHQINCHSQSMNHKAVHSKYRLLYSIVNHVFFISFFLCKE
jgi:hypothetical protein